MEIPNKSNNQEQKDQVRDTVLQRIKTGKAKMRPRWYFALQAALAALWFIIVMAASLYLVSFIFFILNRNGLWFLPVFGWRGIGIFLASLPWLLILAGFVFVVLLEILVRHYSFAYRKPLLYSLLAIITFVTVASVIVLQTSLHRDLDARARTAGVPVVGELYRVYNLPRNGNAHIGMIMEITEDGFQMRNLQDDDDVLFVVVTSETSFPMGVDFQKGDNVFVLGDMDDGVIKALGILRVDGPAGRRSCRDQGWYWTRTCPTMP